MDTNDYLDLLPKIKKIQTEILATFHDFCEENDLKYVLTYGTLLGAVRHKGFIPWDDDIDIAMPRDDYQRFLKIKDKYMKDNNNNFYVQNYLVDNSFFSFTKIRRNHTSMVMKSSKDDDFHQGIWIDIFPLDTMPNNNFLYTLRFMRYSFLFLAVTSVSKSKVKAAKNKINRGLRQVLYYLNNILGRDFFIKRMENLLQTNYGTEYLFDFSNSVPFKKSTLTSFNFSDIENREKLSFEGQMFYVPSNSEIYLKSMYGDYMKFPDPKDQYPHHNVIYVSFTKVCDTK